MKKSFLLLNFENVLDFICLDNNLNNNILRGIVMKMIIFNLTNGLDCEDKKEFNKYFCVKKFDIEIFMNKIEKFDDLNSDMMSNVRKSCSDIDQVNELYEDLVQEEFDLFSDKILNKLNLQKVIANCESNHKFYI